MAFSFGDSTVPAFGNTASKPIGFGTPVVSATTTTNSGFGGFGTSTFGTQQPSSGFGSSFGVSAVPTSAPTFGTAFGGSTTTAPAFATTFGATSTASIAPTFGSGFNASTGFGAQPSSGGLFATTATKPNLFGSSTTSTPFFSTAGATNYFGSAGSNTPAPSVFNNVTTTTPSLFGGGTNLGAPNLFATGTTTPSLFNTSFGATTTNTTAASNLFGGTLNSTQPNASGFGVFGTTNTTTSAPSLFGGFGLGSTGATQPTVNSSFGGFGGTSTSGGFGSGGAFGMKPTQIGAATTVQNTNQQQDQQVMASIYAINIFNDERDDILKKWNLLQACWGTGKGYYSSQQPPVDYSVNNPFYRFKAIGYNVIPDHDNSEGLVKLIFNRKYADLIEQKQMLLTGLTGVLGNKANLKITIQHVKAISETQSEIRILVNEKGVTGINRNIPANDLAMFLNQPQQKQQLTKVGIEAIIPFVTPSKATLEEYLRVVPQGFDPQMWKAAIHDNPNPKKYMPVPIYGFNDLKIRKLKQEHETGMHRAFQEKIEIELEELKKNHASSVARINELKQRFLQLQHRTLKILVKQESIRKNGIAIQPEEEYLKGKLETMQAHLNIPTQFKGQLNELISMIKLSNNNQMKTQLHYKLLPDSQYELKEFLQMQQNGISKLVDIVKDDTRCLNIIDDGLRQVMK